VVEARVDQHVTAAEQALQRVLAHGDVVAAAVQQLLAHAHEEAATQHDAAGGDRVVAAEPGQQRQQPEQQGQQQRGAEHGEVLPRLVEAAVEVAGRTEDGDEREARPEQGAPVRTQPRYDCLGNPGLWCGHLLFIPQMRDVARGDSHNLPIE
jgi:ketosteroid isomerase-like protein